MKQDDKKKDHNNLKVVAKYTSAAFQMAAIIVLGALGGRYLDSYLQNTTKVFTAVLTILAVALALYFFLKDISK